MSKKRALRAFLMAMSIEPSHAPSIRAKALRLPPASTTAMFILAPISFDFSRATFTVARACCNAISLIIDAPGRLLVLLQLAT